MSDLAIVIPAYNAHAQIGGVIESLPPDLRAHAFIIDDGSTPPLHHPTARILRHPTNRGYGATQKTGYAAVIAAGYARVVMLHGDGQYDTAATLALADALEHADAVIGSRFLVDRGRVIPWWRRWANRGLTAAANLRYGQHISELHSGSRAFRTRALAEMPLADFSDDYVFDQQVLVHLLARRRPIAERPVSAAYDDTVQSIALGPSIRYGLGCLKVIARGR